MKNNRFMNSNFSVWYGYLWLQSVRIGLNDLNTGWNKSKYIYEDRKTVKVGSEMAEPTRLVLWCLNMVSDMNTRITYYAVSYVEHDDRNMTVSYISGLYENYWQSLIFWFSWNNDFEYYSKNQPNRNPGIPICCFCENIILKSRLTCFTDRLLYLDFSVLWESRKIENVILAGNIVES